MSGFVLHPEAYADRTDIWEYIAADNLEAADRVIEGIYSKIAKGVAPDMCLSAMYLTRK